MLRLMLLLVLRARVARLLLNPLSVFLFWVAVMFDASCPRVEGSFGLRKSEDRGGPASPLTACVLVF